MNEIPSGQGEGCGTSSSVRVLLVDDSGLARAAMTAVLTSYPCVRIVGEAENGAAALGLAELLRPDLVLTDLDMPELDGCRLVAILRQRYPAMRSIIISAHDMPAMQMLSLLHGADEFIPKDRLAEQFFSLLMRFFPKSTKAGTQKGER